MRDLLTVFRFELLTMLKKKSTIISTVIIALIVLLATLSPLVLFNDQDEPTETPILSMDDVAFDLSALDESEAQMVINVLNLTEDQLIENSQLENSIRQQDFDMGFRVNSLSDVQTIYLNRGFGVENEAIVLNVLRDINRNIEYSKLGIEPGQIQEIEMLAVDNEVLILGRDSMSNYLITYILSFILYFIVIMYGTTVATAIAREKDDRTMELLVTSTKPTNLIVGKVLGVGIGTLIQVGVIFLAGFIGFNIAKGSYPDIVFSVLETTVTWDMILVHVFYFLLGFFLYLFLFSAVGSVVSRVEDVNSAVMPVMVFIMIALFIAMFSINNVNSLMARLSAQIPFTSFIAMPTRYLLASIEPIELIMSMIFMIVGVVVLTFISIKIYRWGTLYYGNRVNLLKIIRRSLTKE